MTTIVKGDRFEQTAIGQPRIAQARTGKALATGKPLKGDSEGRKEKK